MSTADNDQIGLIQNDEELPQAENIHPSILPLFFGLKLLPIILFFLPPHSFILLFIIIFMEILITQYFLSYKLVGLTWKVDLTYSSKQLILFIAEPDPYVPLTINSNCFWITTVISTIFWFIASLISFLVKKGLIHIFFAFAIDCIVIGNTVNYLKAYQLATKSAGDAVRSVLLGETDEFKKFNENEIKSNLSSSYDDEYSNPPENAETIEKKEEKSEQNNSEIISHSE